jgi:peptidoglycan/LPS O-acetylase OafA/YrhL
VFVVVHHEFGHVPGVVFGHVLTRALAFMFSRGHEAVDVFIVLSGFSLMLPVVRGGGHLAGGAVRFFVKRARRILPPYFIAMGISLALIATLVGRETGTHWDLSLPVRPRDVVAHVLLIQDVDRRTASTINHALWSISVEWRIYLAFPLLVLAARRVGSIGAAALAAGASAAGWVALLAARPAFPNLNLTPWGICPHYLLLFALGMVAADIATGQAKIVCRTRLLPWGTYLLASAAIVMLGFAARRLGVAMPWPIMDVLVGMWTMCLLVFVTASETAGPHAQSVRAALAWPPLAGVGTFAYTIYLVHAPLVQVVWQYAIVPLRLAPPFAVGLLVLAGTPVIVAACYVAFQFCERPFLMGTATRRSTRDAIDVAPSGAT